MLVTEEIFQSFLNCKTKSYLKFSGAVETQHEFRDWQRRQIEDYKQKCYDQLRSKFRGDACLIGISLSQALENSKCHLVFDCLIKSQEIQTRIHALERVTSSSHRKNISYIPIRFVPRQKITKQDKLLLAYDAFILSLATRKKPLFGKIIYSREQRTTKVQLAELIKSVQSIVMELIEQLTSQTIPQLILNKHCPQCDFENQCRQIADEKDDLSLLSNMTEKERQKQHNKGIFTVTQLSYTFRPRRRPKRLASRPKKYSHALKALAIREQKIHVARRPEPKIIGTPVYLDVEGNPDQGFYYLIGLRTKSDSSYIQHSFWANESSDEKVIWFSFLQTLSNLENPQLIYFGNYEKVFLKRMKERYCDTVETNDFIEQLIAKSVNILSMIYGQIYFPVYSNGLKSIAQYLGFQWSESTASGLNALIWRCEWELSKEPNVKQKLITYNAEDCVALERVVNAVAQLCHKRDGEAESGNNDVVYTDSLKRRSSMYNFGTREFLVPELQHINQAAYWDYQREKIYLRSTGKLKNRRSGSIKKRKRPKAVPINQVIECQPPNCCPQCKSTQIIKRRKMSRVVHDLKFGRAGIKRWIVRYRFDRYFCEQCGNNFHHTPRPWTGGKYGPNLLAYIIYQLIELRLSLRVVAQHINQLFNININRWEILRQKAKVAKLYNDTYEGILSNIVEGSLVHADETRSGIKREGSYVWVLANWEEVVYFYAKTRDGSLIQDKLKEYKGVLVSDFYSVYDSIDCLQQKCLIHLLRDLDDDLHKQPLNEELQELVEEFARILRSVVETIDRFGLKARFLRKYKVLVKRFYKWLSKQDYKSEIAVKYRKRFEKNRDKLFTFLDCDGVPWNNNNAEHAIKVFAQLRKALHGTSTENGLKAYLTLLSIYQTCKYKGVSFLDFLRSGEKDIGVYIQRNVRRSKRLVLQ